MNEITPITTVLYYVSLPALAFQICEWLRNLSFETEKIWPKPPCLSKWQYIYSTYMAIVYQVVHLLIIPLLLSPHSMGLDTKLCKAWYIFFSITGQSMHLSLELTILYRVYALYNRNKVVVTVLSCLVIAESILIPSLILHFLLGGPDLIHGTCMIQQLPLRIIGVPVFQMIVHASLYGATIWKKDIKGVPVLSLVIRDGSWMFASACVVFAGMSAQIAVSSHRLTAAALSIAILPIYLAFISSINCWLIRNMEGVTCQERPTSPQSSDASQTSGPLFTSFAGSLSVA